MDDFPPAAAAALYNDALAPHLRCPSFTQCLASVPSKDAKVGRLILSPYGFTGADVPPPGSGRRLVIVGDNPNDGDDPAHAPRGSGAKLARGVAADYDNRKVMFLANLIPVLRVILGVDANTAAADVLERVMFTNGVRCAPNTNGSEPTPQMRVNCRAMGYLRDDLVRAIPDVVICIHGEAFATLQAAFPWQTVQPRVWGKAVMEGRTVDVLFFWHPSKPFRAAAWERALTARLGDCRPESVAWWDREPLFTRHRSLRSYCALALSVWRLCERQRGMPV